MKILFFVLMFLSSSTFAAETNVIAWKRGYSIQTELKYQTDGKSVSTTKEFVLSRDSKAWVNLVTPEKGVTLLGRLVQDTGKAFKVEYIVIDTAREDAVVTIPSMHATLGEKAKVKIDAKDLKVSISLLAKETNFYNKN